MSRVRIDPVERVRARLEVPGDKSISHRALILNAVAAGAARVGGLAPGGDVASTARALARLGAEVERLGGGEWRVSGERARWASPAPVDCGNSGTTARLLLGILASRAEPPTALTGDASLRARPMGRVVEPLRAAGAAIDPAEPGGDGRRLPLKVAGRPLAGVEHRLAVASAQVESALLLAGLAARGRTVVISPGASRDHTPRLLAAMGAEVAVEPLAGGGRRVSLSPGPVEPIDLEVPGDLSSAAFLLALAAALPGSEIVVEDVGLNPGRTGFLEILAAMGAEVEIEVEAADPEPRGTVRVAAAGLVGVDVGPALVPRAIDELPLVAVLGAVAEGTTRVSGAAELKVKESDRIGAIAAGLGAMGAEVETTADGFSVRGPARLSGAALDAAGDHRIGMALAVAALLARRPSELSGAEWIDVSWPGFLDTVAACAGGRTREPRPAAVRPIPPTGARP